MELIEIGKVGKPFGTEGLLRCFINARYLADFLESEVFFVRLTGQAVPFFIEGVEGDGESLLVQVEEMDDREEALKLSGKELYLRMEDLISDDRKTETASQQQYERWVGFRLKDQTLGELGQIESFIELPQQLLAILHYEGKEVMIPFQEKLILEINPSDKTVLMDLPEGLLEL